MRSAALPLIGVSLLAAFVVDAYALPDYSITTIYVIPILAAAYYFSSKVVGVTAAIAVSLNLIGTYLDREPFPVWLFHGLSLVVVSTIITAVAILLARQRQQIAQVNQHLQQTLLDFQAVLDATENGVLVYDQHLTVRLINRRLAGWFGVDPAQVAAQPLDEFIRKQVAPKLADTTSLLTHVDRGQQDLDAVMQGELTQVQPEYRTLRFSSSPMHMHDTPTGRIATFADITEIRRREEEWEALGQAAKALVREVTLERVAEVVTEQAQRVLRARDVVVYLVDEEREELRLLAQRDVSPAALAETRILPLMAPAVATQAARTGKPIEIPDFHALGQEFTIGRRWAEREGVRSGVAQPLFAKGRLVGVLTIAKADPHHFTIQERELIAAFADLCTAAIEHARLYDAATQRSQEADEARQRLQDFMGMVSHDLRGPLGVIQGYTQLLLRRSRDGWSAMELKAIEGIASAGQHMRRLIHDLLDAARIGAGRFEVTPLPMDLVAVACQVVAQYQETTSKHLIVLNAPARLEGCWDPERMSQLCANLISNAIKYAPQGGEIRVLMQETDGEALVCVSDHGVGIAPDKLSTLFQPYSHSADERADGGVGLGLYISRGIIEAHGGRIWAESALGKGSSFFIALPRGNHRPAV